MSPTTLDRVWGNRLCFIFVYVDIELDKVFPQKFFYHLVFVAVSHDFFSSETSVIHEWLFIFVDAVFINATSALHFEILRNYLPFLYMRRKFEVKILTISRSLSTSQDNVNRSIGAPLNTRPNTHLYGFINWFLYNAIIWLLLSC